MKLQYFGHSFWKIITDQMSVVIDPYTDIGYPMPVDLHADVVLVSHEHYDHNNVSLIKGNPEVFRTAGMHQHGNLKVELIPAYHDEMRGAKRGVNHIIRLILEGKTIVHTGDLGHIPEKDALARIFRPDILFVPAGEIYTLSLDDVCYLIEKTTPKLVFPMHYRTTATGIKLGELQPFLKRATNVLNISSNCLELDEELFTTKRTVVMSWLGEQNC